jgi:serine/threonine protein kinase
MGGGDVFDRVLKKTKYTERDARQLTTTLLKATRCMHEAGVAHRDLKPQNLLLTVSVCRLDAKSFLLVIG